MTDSGTPLHHVWQYTDADKVFWDRHLEGWVPDDIVDAHIHVFHASHRRFAMTDEMRHSYWVNELNHPQDAEDLDRAAKLVWPDRRVRHLGFGWPDLDYDIDAANAYLVEQCPRRDWHSLALVPPSFNADQVQNLLSQPGCIGVKPYYAMISRTPENRDTYLEASIFDMLPHHVLEVVNEQAAWVTLHVPKADRLGHPDNLREIVEIRKRYPRVILVIAHLGRCYTLPHAQETFTSQLAEDPGLYFDTSAVLNPDVLRLALERFGHERLLFGTDNPVFYMRGQRQWSGRTYRNRTSHPFHFNRDREPLEIEAGYTLFMYEALKALKDACADLSLGQREIAAIFHDNADRLMRQANTA